MKLLLLFVLFAFTFAAEDGKTETKNEESNKQEKRQIEGHVLPGQISYRHSRKHHKVAPVQEPMNEKTLIANMKKSFLAGYKNVANEEYRPGQVFSVDSQELLELQPERKAPVASSQNLQPIYANPPEQKDIQQFYFIQPEPGQRQVTLQPSHTVIARPLSSADGGEASVGAALSVSDSGASSSDSSFDDELLALLGHAPVRQHQLQQQTYTQAAPTQQPVTQSVAAQYQQIDRYITKPTKKPTKLRPKAQQPNQPQSASAPQQYHIETTNVQSQPQPQVQHQQPQQSIKQQQLAPHQQYRYVQQRPLQSLRYVPFQQPLQQQFYYEVPESQSQGIKIVSAPKLQQQQKPQFAYRLISQHQQEAAAPKQFRVIEAQRPQIQSQPNRPEPTRIPASSIDRPITYLKRYPEVEKLRAVKFYEQPENLPVPQIQSVADQYYLRSFYRPVDHRGRYEQAQYGTNTEQPVLDATKPPHSAIYVSKSITPKKVVPHPQLYRVDQPVQQAKELQKEHRQELHRQELQRQEIQRQEQASNEQLAQSIDAQRPHLPPHLPPPKNGKAYTPEEFSALVAAGYSVTPIPVGPYADSPQVAESRSSIEPSVVSQVAHRRPLYSRPSRRHQYLPLRSDEAP